MSNVNVKKFCDSESADRCVTEAFIASMKRLRNELSNCS